MRGLYRNNNVIITYSDKEVGVILDSTHYNAKITELFNDKSTYEQISLQTRNKNIVFNKSYKKI